MQRHSSTTKSIENDLPDHLLCPICFNIPLEEVYQCVDGHVMCKKCHQKLDECPQCRRPLNKVQPIRCRHLEGILEGVRLDCCFKSNGCQANLPKGVLRNHQSICSFDFKRFGKLVNICKLLSFINCVGFRVNNGNGRNALEHFIDEHDCILTRSDKFQMELTNFLDSPTWTPIIVELKEKKCFLLIIAFSIEVDESIGWLSLFIPSVNNEDFSKVPVQLKYTIMSNEAGSSLTLKYSFIQDPITLTTIEQVLPPEKLPNRFQIQSLSPYVTNEGTLQVTCQVKQKQTKKEERKEKLESFVCSSTSNNGSRPSKAPLTQRKNTKARARTPKRTNRKWGLFETPVLIYGVALLVMLGLVYLGSMLWHKSAPSSSENYEIEAPMGGLTPAQAKRRAEAIKNLELILHGKGKVEIVNEIPVGASTGTSPGKAIIKHVPGQGVDYSTILNQLLEDDGEGGFKLRNEDQEVGNLAIKQFMESVQMEEEIERKSVIEENIEVSAEEFDNLLTGNDQSTNFDAQTLDLMKEQIFEEDGKGGRRIAKDALFQVAEIGDVSTYEFFKGKFDVDMVDEEEEDETLLHRVLRAEKNKTRGLEKIKFLLEQGANTQVVTLQKQSPLHYAALYSNSVDAVKYILNQGGAEINGLDEDRNTPLNLLVQNENEKEALKIAEELLKSGADCKIKNVDGYTPQESSKVWKKSRSVWRRIFNKLCNKYNLAQN